MTDEWNPTPEGPSASKPRLLVVDDDPGMVSLLTRGLGAAGYAVDSARDGLDALERLRADLPDLLILDLMLPRLDGLDVCREVRKLAPALPVLILTARDTSADEVTGLDVGADTYVTKPFDLKVLLARVRALLRFRTEDVQQELRFANLSLDPRTRTAERGRRIIPLTDTEFRLLRFFVAHPRQVLSKDQILERIWGYDFSGSVNVVEVFVGSLRRALEADGESRLIHTIRGAGYCLRELG